MPFENPVGNSAVYYRSGNDIVNPRWTLKNALDTETVRRFFGRSSLSLEANDWLKLDIVQHLTPTHRHKFVKLIKEVIKSLVVK